ncbi:glycosyltransferase family 4 protein [Thermodesulfobacteriota bacterium]
MSEKKQRIGFLLGSPDINGGTYVIYEHGSRLADLGYEVLMLTKEKVTAERYRWHPGAQKLGWLTMSEAEEFSFDLVFATYWQSPFLLPQLQSRQYAYFVQSIESRFFAEPDPTHHNNRELDIWRAYCESTYSLNVPVITEAKWIQKYLHEHHNRSSFLVRNGIRKDIYTETGPAISKREPGKLRALVEGPVDVFYKNVPKSVELCRQAGVDEVWLLTSSDISEFEGVDRVFSRVPIHEAPEIYRSCDVLVKLSYVEGMFGPPLEIFHCGGTAIVYDVTGHDEYIVHNENSYVVEKDDDEQVISYLQRLKEDDSELNRLKKAARKTADSWPDWKEAAQEFEQAVLQINKTKAMNRKYLEHWSATHKDNVEIGRCIKGLGSFAEREEATGEKDYDRHNFVQIYSKAGDGEIDPGQEIGFFYQCDQDVVITAKLSITGLPFWIRIDPSVRIGVVIIDSINVTHCISGEIFLMLATPEDFNDVYLGGTIKRIGWESKNVFLSYGIDPWFYLPQITNGEIGDELEVTIELREIGMTQFANRYTMGPAGGQKTDNEGIISKFLRKVSK